LEFEYLIFFKHEAATTLDNADTQYIQNALAMNYFDIYSIFWVTKTFVSIVRGPKITTKGNLAVTT